MFNTTNNKYQSKVVAVTQVVEKTITPDKVTDMYDKVEKEVMSKIARSVKIESNQMHGTAFEIHEIYSDMTSTLVIRFDFNGKEHLIIQKGVQRMSTEWQLVEEIMNYIGEYIKKEIFSSIKKTDFVKLK